MGGHNNNRGILCVCVQPANQADTNHSPTTVSSLDSSLVSVYKQLCETRQNNLCIYNSLDIHQNGVQPLYSHINAEEEWWYTTWYSWGMLEVLAYQHQCHQQAACFSIAPTINRWASTVATSTGWGERKCGPAGRRLCSKGKWRYERIIECFRPDWW